MGNHERNDIELLEKSVANSLNNLPPFIQIDHKWYPHLRAFVSYIKTNYNFSKATHIGNSYADEFGDIKLLLNDNNVIFIELKASETEGGLGTLANISQNAVTNYCLLTPGTEKKIFSWSEFRTHKQFEEKILSLLNQYIYPPRINFADKGRHVRDMVKKDDQKAITIKKQITELAKIDKKDYVNYISKFNVNEGNLRKFVFCMVNGIHTEKEILHFFSQTPVDLLKDKYDYITTLYSNMAQGTASITKGDSKTKILFNDYTNFSFSFPDESSDTVKTDIQCINKKTQKPTTLISLQYHWKNVFQGIQTPCINVFLGPFFYAS